ncbi:MAG: hypothetical protein J6125_02765 [Clostridia bacterium]|nr:hypothetical protein [Clostridia bacterium]
MWEDQTDVPAPPCAEDGDELPSPYAEDLVELRSALAETTAKLTLLDRVRALLEENDGDEKLLTLFSALLDAATEIRCEADRLSEDLALLEDELSDAVWSASRHAAGGGVR